MKSDLIVTVAVCVLVGMMVGAMVVSGRDQGPQYFNDEMENLGAND
jgi:hypothetical protein